MDDVTYLQESFFLYRSRKEADRVSRENYSHLLLCGGINWCTLKDKILRDKLIPLNELAESGHCFLVDAKVHLVLEESQQISPMAAEIREQYISTLHEL